MTRLEPGQPAPDFALPDQDGGVVSLRELRGQKVILFIYPAAMTPGCTTQACDFRDAEAALQADGYVVLGLSPDRPEKLQRFAERDALSFPLLSDPEKETMTAYGAFGEKMLYGKTVVGVIRSTFVIDEEGVIQLARYNVRAKGHVAALRKLLP